MYVDSWFTLLESAFAIGIGPVTFTTGVPQSIGLATGAIIGANPETAIKGSIAVWVPQTVPPLISARATLNKFGIGRFIRAFYSGSLGAMEQILDGFWMEGIFCQISTNPQPTICPICPCNPEIDQACPIVIFEPAFVLAVAKFSLFNTITGGVYIGYSPIRYKVNSWVNAFTLGPFDFGAYKKPPDGLDRPGVGNVLAETGAGSSASDLSHEWRPKFHRQSAHVQQMDNYYNRKIEDTIQTPSDRATAHAHLTPSYMKHVAHGPRFIDGRLPSLNIEQPTPKTPSDWFEEELEDEDLTEVDVEAPLLGGMGKQIRSKIAAARKANLRQQKLATQQPSFLQPHGRQLLRLGKEISEKETIRRVEQQTANEIQQKNTVAQQEKAASQNVSTSEIVRPEDCAQAEWSSWYSATKPGGAFVSDCSEPCGGGQQARIRRVLRPATNGGRPCLSVAESVQSRECNTQPCSDPCTQHELCDIQDPASGKIIKQRCKDVCGQCTRDEQCGYCPLTGECKQGTSVGAASAKCAGWEFDFCNPAARGELEAKMKCELNEKCNGKSSWEEVCAATKFGSCMQVHQRGCPDGTYDVFDAQTEGAGTTARISCKEGRSVPDTQCDRDYSKLCPEGWKEVSNAVDSRVVCTPEEGAYGELTLIEMICFGIYFDERLVCCE